MQLPLDQVQAILAVTNAIPSKRGRILKALSLLLPTITKTNGYNNSAEGVSFDVKSWADKTEDQTPWIYIVDDKTQITRHAGQMREFVWDIRLFGVLKGKDIMTFETFITDIEQCIYDNNSLFGNVNKMEVEEVTTDNQLFSEINDSGAHLFEMVVKMEYTRSARDAR
jgi:hypothetical protein